MNSASVSTIKTPYKSGHPVDSIPIPNQKPFNHDEIQMEYRTYLGSLLWISQGTRPYMSTITNILAKHQLHPTLAHINAAKHAIKYLKSTKSMGISFHQDKISAVEAFFKFPLPQD